MQLNPQQADLMRYMEQFRQLRGTPPKGHVYAGMEDFLIREGVWCEPAPLPPNVDIGAPKSCFSNALTLAILHDYTYMEGLAIPGFIIGFPVHHAWNIDSEGRLIDNTWIKYPGVAYRGVPFSIGRADQSIWAENALGILDNPRQWMQLYRSQWQGEYWGKVWQCSKHRKQLDRIKARKPRKGALDAPMEDVQG